MSLYRFLRAHLTFVWGPFAVSKDTLSRTCMRANTYISSPPTPPFVSSRSTHMIAIILWWKSDDSHKHRSAGCVARRRHRWVSHYLIRDSARQPADLVSDASIWSTQIYRQPPPVRLVKARDLSADMYRDFRRGEIARYISRQPWFIRCASRYGENIVNMRIRDIYRLCASIAFRSESRLYNKLGLLAYCRNYINLLPFLLLKSRNNS